MYLDFAASDASTGGYVLLAGRSFWAGVVGLGDHPLVALRDDDVPRGRGLDVRAEGLWASLTCETPDQHWSVAMEAFAVGYDDPAGALGDERGDRVALGFDLEWERVGDIWRVHGEVLVADARIALDTFGSVAADPAPLVTGRLDDRTAFMTSDLIPVVSPDGLLAGGVAVAGDTRVQLQPVHHAPVKPVGRALCLLNPGVAWVSASPADGSSCPATPLGRTWRPPPVPSTE